MAFLMGAESVLQFAEGEIGNIASQALPYFETKGKELVSNVIANEINSISRNSSSNSFVNQTLTKIQQKQRLNHPVKQGRKIKRT